MFLRRGGHFVSVLGFLGVFFPIVYFINFVYNDSSVFSSVSVQTGALNNKLTKTVMGLKGARR